MKGMSSPLPHLRCMYMLSYMRQDDMDLDVLYSNWTPQTGYIIEALG